MCACDRLMRLVRRQCRALHRRAELFGKMQRGIENRNQQQMREACKEMEELEGEHAGLAQDIVEALERACDRRGISPGSATLGRLVDEADGELETRLSELRRELAGAVAVARRSAESVRRLASVAADWNAHMIEAISGSDPAGQTYSENGEFDRGHAGVMMGRWG